MKSTRKCTRKIAGIAILLSLMVITFIYCGYKKENKTLGSIAYDKSKKNYTVFIKENDEYVPYLVLTSNYNGNALLLRKNLLSEPQPYKKHGPGWSWYEYGSYYEESSVDKFLNTEFFGTLSESTRKAILTSEIEVTDKESYDEWNYKTHLISRKVFLLSSTELGVEGLESVTVTEGKPLKYFKNKEFVEKKAFMSDGTEWPYWTRTPELWETCTVLTIGVESLGSGTADVSIGVRPAFCMSNDMVLDERSDVIDGSRVYVIE